MTNRILVSALVLAACAPLEAQPSSSTSTSDVIRRLQSSRSAFYAAAMERGAVSEVSLRVPPDKLDDYLALYTKWFFPVDIAKNSGRRLLTILTREHGDDHNLVFLYWYESPYKEDYYCKFAEAFFNYHLNHKDARGGTEVELRKLYEDAALVLSPGRVVGDNEALLNGLRNCTANNVPEAAGEAIRQVDEKFRQLVTSDSASWSFGVNPCRAYKVDQAVKGKRPLERSELDRCEKSLLESVLAPPAPLRP